MPGRPRFIADYHSTKRDKADMLTLKLYWAADTGDLAEVRKILARGINPNKGPETDGEILIIAIIRGHTDVVHELLTHGAHANVEKDDGWGTPLMAAAKWGHIDIVRELLFYGADVNPTKKGMSYLLLPSPLSVAVGPNANIDVVRELIAHGANINAWSHNTNILSIAFENALYRKHKGVGEGDPMAIVRLLLSHGAKINKRSIISAIHSEDEDILRFMLDKDINIPDHINAAVKDEYKLNENAILKLPSQISPKVMDIINKYRAEKRAPVLEELKYMPPGGPLREGGIEYQKAKEAFGMRTGGKTRYRKKTQRRTSSRKRRFRA